MTPSSQRMLASILLRNAGQPVRHPLQALSNIANTYFGYKALGRADKADDREALNKSMVLNQAIRTGRGWTNPDDTYTQLRQQIVKGVPIAQQPGAKIMSTPRNEWGQKIPSVPGSQQAMADVLLGAGGKYPDLMKMGMNMYGQEAALQRAQEARKLQLGDMINKLELQSKQKNEENIGKELRKINNERIQHNLPPLTESDYLARTSVGAGPIVQRGDGQGKTLAEIAFVSTSACTEDLHITEDSVCVDAGTDLGTTGGTQTDINGRDRDSEGDTWDIGAHEFVADADTTGAAFIMFVD